MKWYSVRPSVRLFVCPIHLLQQCVVGLLLWAWRAGDAGIDHGWCSSSMGPQHAV